MCGTQARSFCKEHSNGDTKSIIVHIHSFVGRVHLEESVLPLRKHTDLRKKRESRKVKKIKKLREKKKVEKFAFRKLTFDFLKFCRMMPDAFPAEHAQIFFQLREPGRGGNHSAISYSEAKTGMKNYAKNGGTSEA